METNNFIFENSFFAIKKSFENNSVIIWHLIRKIRHIPGSNGELMEVLAPSLYTTKASLYFFDLQDYDLSNEFVSLGGNRLGYLSNDINGEFQIDGLSEQFNANIIDFNSITKNVNIFKNLFQILEPMHNLRCTNQYFIESFFKRDRIFWGLTFDNKNNSDNKINNKTKIISKTHDNWKDIISNRRSADCFEFTIDYDIVLDLLSESLFFNENNKSLYASAGNINCLNTYIATRNVFGISNGIYKVNPYDRRLENIGDFSEFDILNNFLFLDDQLSKASVYFFYSFKYNNLLFKYGHRTLRLGLLTIGGAIQQVHLASTAHGLKYRTIGGFDELQCSKILNLDESEYLVCMGILGK